MVRAHTVVTAVVLCVLFSGMVFAAEDGLVAHYTFAEGRGGIVRDHSVNANHGQISGAKWVKNGKRWALEFDGVDDFVNCGDSPSLALRDTVTIEAWVYAEPIFSVYMQVPIVGKGRYQLTQWVGEATAFGNGFANGFMPIRKWTHIALTTDGATEGKRLRLFIDGKLMAVRKGIRDGWGHYHIPHSNMLLMAGPNRMRAGETESRFKGKIASVKIYNRALTHKEILEDIRTSNITGSVIPSPIPLPGFSKIKVEVDAARLGQPLEKIRYVEVGVYPVKPEDAKPIFSKSINKFDNLGRAVVDLDVPQMKQGEYAVRATAKDAAGKVLGVPGEETISWAGSAQFPSGPKGARRLNNLVTELLRVQGPDKSGRTHSFVNPRQGFIFISNRGSKDVKLAAKGSADVMTVSLSQDYDDAYETMRYLPKGKYTITTRLAKDLFVRAVAETIYDYAHTVLGPQHGTKYVWEYGPYAGEFEERYVFPHCNTFHVHDYNIDKPFVKEWKAKGRRMLAIMHFGCLKKEKEGKSKEDVAYEALTNDPGFTHPLFDGCMYDEFSHAAEPLLIWINALDRAMSEPRFKGKTWHAFNFALYDLVAYDGGEAGHKFVRTLQKYNNAILWELYTRSRRTELDAWRHINAKLVGEPLAASEKCPGLIDNLIVFPYSYVNAGPPWMCVTLPGIDSLTLFEMQIRTVATHPAFQGICGLGTFRSTYADEEMVRWTARLYRHYAIEGNTEPLRKDPYVLTHIENPEFEHEGLGWDLKPAEEGAIRFDVFRGFGSMQGRYPRISHGDTVIVTKRSAKGPNTFSQEIKNLEPGRLYSFRMFSADHKNIWKKQKLAVSIKFDNATLIPEKCFTHIGSSRYSHKGSLMNWHVRVFRAKGKTATLTVSDWPGEKKPGGPIGQELMYNFIKVQPYWAP